MRADALGLFWEDRPPEPKQAAEKIKRTPPEPVWLRPDYLPGLDEAIRFNIPLMNDTDLVCANMTRERLLFDIECYSNYFLASFRSVKTGKAICFEMYDGCQLDIVKLKWVLTHCETVGFNSLGYDLPITYLALAGKPCEILKRATEMIIVEGWRGRDVLKQFKVSTRDIKVNHIDLIEVAPLRASLKIYGGRLHTPRMQDLPFHPDTELSPEQRLIVRWYNVNADLTSTGFLHECLRDHIDLRTTLSNETGLDLRSRSDAQIAESVIGMEYTRKTGMRATVPLIEPGTAYRYKVPHFIQYQSQLMNYVLQTVANSWYVVDHTGSFEVPKEVQELKIDMNGSVYRMGNGGLHSSEKRAYHVADNNYILKDVDVTSYYPYIILNLGLYPHHLGSVFLDIFRTIVERRVDAKRRGDKVTADSLKITINGSFGKLGNKYSILYSPDLMIQVTITGQLSLLMLIERLELAGIHVVSANTDGIVIKCRRDMEAICNTIISQWEKDTGFGTEETRYLALLSRDVNNYVAVKQKFDEELKIWLDEPDGTKNKGAYANPWSSKKNLAERLHKNPVNIICIEAVQELLTKGRPLSDTIRSCKDITKFCSVRTVKGGAVKVWEEIPPPAHNSQEELLKLAGWQEIEGGYWIRNGSSDRTATDKEAAYRQAVRDTSTPTKIEFLGKSIRWYYAAGLGGEIVYATTGNKVPRSDGAKPMMDLPAQFPDDVDYDWYEAEATRMLQDIGYLERETA